MYYYEVIPADSRYKSELPLTYSSDKVIANFSIVTIDLKNKSATGLIIKQVSKPKFKTKPVKAIISSSPLPEYCLQISKWIKDYYHCALADALKLYMPPKPVIKKSLFQNIKTAAFQAQLHNPLTLQQKNVIKQILSSNSVTTLLHGETGSGKTRVYTELSKKYLTEKKSVIILTPEITLTAQLFNVFSAHVENKIFVLHSQLSSKERKKLWFEILETEEPVVIIGPRSALFSPVKNLGLIVLDEAHEPAYKQEQTPRYQTARVASHLGAITKSRVILGTATPLITDYYLASRHNAVIEMNKDDFQNNKVSIQIIDLKERSNFNESPYVSKQLISETKQVLKSNKQALIYLNRRGSSRLILCNKCSWQSMCPNCDIPLVYHGDTHQTKCHICNYTSKPPVFCPVCTNTDIIYKSIGSKALTEEVKRLFPNYVVKRFDGDNTEGERLNELYPDLLNGKIDILVGTQVIAKGLDLPRLGLVGIVAAETSMGLPDFSSEERSFQLLHQVIGRVGRGHGSGKVIIQTYEPNSNLITSAMSGNWLKFYKSCLQEREKYHFPPFVYLLQLTCKKSSAASAQKSADNLLAKLKLQELKVEFIGPTPCFYLKRGNNYYYQIIIKSSDRNRLLKISNLVPVDWQISLDPLNLL